jgi:hypothetical protein
MWNLNSADNNTVQQTPTNEDHSGADPKDMPGFTMGALNLAPMDFHSSQVS